MTAKITAKNVEIYVGTVVDTVNFLPDSKGNDTTYAQYVDDAITASDISGFTKISDRSNAFSMDPGEDETETKNYFGSTAGGSQNSDTLTTTNSDVDISVTVDTEVTDFLSKMGMDANSDTHASVSNYGAYSLGSSTTDTYVMLIRVKRLVGSTYYFRNILILNPVFKKPGAVDANSDDTALETTFELLGNKSEAWVDFYDDTSDETFTNF